MTFMKHLLVAATVSAGVWLVDARLGGAFLQHPRPPPPPPFFFFFFFSFEAATFPEVTRLVNNRGVLDKRASCRRCGWHRRSIGP